MQHDSQQSSAVYRQPPPHTGLNSRALASAVAFADHRTPSYAHSLGPQRSLPSSPIGAPTVQATFQRFDVQMHAQPSSPMSPNGNPTGCVFVSSAIFRRNTNRQSQESSFYPKGPKLCVGQFVHPTAVKSSRQLDSSEHPVAVSATQITDTTIRASILYACRPTKLSGTTTPHAHSYSPNTTCSVPIPGVAFKPERQLLTASCCSSPHGRWSCERKPAYSTLDSTW